MTSKREIRRAARDAREEVRRALPGDFFSWIECAIEDSPNPDRARLLAGTLAGIGLELERAYKVSGSRVRDAVLYLHRVLNSGQAPGKAVGGAPPDFPAAETCHKRIEWLLKSEPPESAQLRRAIFGWIEIANQRLTMDRYPRADERARHARALIAAPCQIAGVDLHEARAEWVLRLWDLLGAEDAARGGQNLVAGEARGLGGFYAISDDCVPPSGPEMSEALRLLRADAEGICHAPAAIPPRQQEAFGLILSGIDARISSGAWPQGLSRAASPARAGLWRRIFG